MIKIASGLFKLTYNSKIIPLKRIDALSVHMFFIHSVFFHPREITFPQNFVFLLCQEMPRFLFLVLLFLNTLSLSIKTTVLHEWWPLILCLFKNCCKTISKVRFLIINLWIFFKNGTSFDFNHSLGNLPYVVKSELDF